MLGLLSSWMVSGRFFWSCVRQLLTTCTSAVLYGPLMGSYRPSMILRTSAPIWRASKGYRPVQHSYCAGQQARQGRAHTHRHEAEGQGLRREAAAAAGKSKRCCSPSHGRQLGSACAGATSNAGATHHDDAQRPYVALLVVRLVVALLGRKVVGRAHNGVRVDAAVAQRASNAQVAYLDVVL